MEISVRLARLDDSPTICIILRRSITEVCTKDHKNNPDIISAWTKNKTIENVNSWLLNPDNYSFISSVNGIESGFGLMSSSGEILLCYVLPEALHVGVGSILLNSMIETAKNIGVQKVTVDSTQTAKGFYERNGFLQSCPSKSEFGVICSPLELRLNID